MLGLLTLIQTFKNIKFWKSHAGGSCGQLLPNTQMKVIDLDSGELLGAGERGELCFTGPQAEWAIGSFTKQLLETRIIKWGWENLNAFSIWPAIEKVNIFVNFCVSLHFFLSNFYGFGVDQSKVWTWQYWSCDQLWSQVMKGYFNNDKATQETLFDGWIHTGDIGYYDEVSVAQWTIKLSDRS